MLSAISLCNVVKHYRRGKEAVAVLHGLSLGIPEGEFVRLMGPSGFGKTTLLNLVGGLGEVTRQLEVDKGWLVLWTGASA